jgi:hypothetical protein
MSKVALIVMGAPSNDIHIFLKCNVPQVEFDVPTYPGLYIRRLLKNCVNCGSCWAKTKEKIAANTGAKRSLVILIKRFLQILGAKL